MNLCFTKAAGKYCRQLFINQPMMTDALLPLQINLSRYVLMRHVTNSFKHQFVDVTLPLTWSPLNAQHDDHPQQP